MVEEGGVTRNSKDSTIEKGDDGSYSYDCYCSYPGLTESCRGALERWRVHQSERRDGFVN